MNLSGCLKKIFIIVFEVWKWNQSWQAWRTFSVQKTTPQKSISVELIYAKKFAELIFTIFKANPKIKSGQSFKLTELQKLVLQHFSKWRWKVTENANKIIQPYTYFFLASNAKGTDLKSFITNTKNEVWTKMNNK